MKTEILGIELQEHISCLGYWVDMPNASKMYHGLLVDWFKRFVKEGASVALIGENKKEVKDVFKNILNCQYDLIDCVKENEVDILWDITEEINEFEYGFKQYDFIMCQSVLEHVVDPTCAVENMTNVLKEGGLLAVHTVGPAFPDHKYPIDTFRFMKDIFPAWAQRFNLTMVDLFYTTKHCAVLYRK